MTPAVPVLDISMNDSLLLLQQRRSVPMRQLGDPAPPEHVLEALFEAAVRVPDHGKLVPFRLIFLRGEAKRSFGDRLTELAIRRDPDLPEASREKERLRYGFAPLVVVVVARIDARSSIPVLEQQLSAGCVAYNLLLGTQALGYGAQWVTGWACYDRDVATVLGLTRHEHAIGFVHIGTARTLVPDRHRPSLDHVLSEWTQ